MQYRASMLRQESIPLLQVFAGQAMPATIRGEMRHEHSGTWSQISTGTRLVFSTPALPKQKLTRILDNPSRLTTYWCAIVNGGFFEAARCDSKYQAGLRNQTSTWGKHANTKCKGALDIEAYLHICCSARYLNAQVGRRRNSRGPGLRLRVDI